MNFKSIMTLLLAALMTAGTLASCGGDQAENTDTAAVNSETAADLFLCQCTRLLRLRLVQLSDQAR